MNEIKRQLNKKIGDTKGRAETVMAKVEQKKRQVSVKKKSNIPYYAAMIAFAATIALFFIFGPLKNEPISTTDPDPIVTPEPGKIETDVSYFELLKRYFKKHDDVGYFLGSGNEYASYRETTTWLSEEYVELTVDNGGGVTRKIYHITEDTIYLVYEDMIDEGHPAISIDQLKLMQPISILLKAPFETGTEFEGKTMTYPATVVTPAGTFDNAVLVTEVSEYGTNRYYYAEDFGLVGVISLMDDGGELSSLLASINVLPVADPSIIIPVLNTTTNEEETFKLADLPFINPMLYGSSAMDNLKLEYKVLSQTSDYELGAFTYDCSEKNCGLTIVVKQGGLLNIITSDAGSILPLSYSPNKEHVIFPIVFYESTGSEDSLIAINHLVILNLKTLTMVIPGSNVEYFYGSIYPIVDFKWLNDVMIQLNVADLKNYYHETILEWQNTSPRKTKEILITLTN